jgi:hypothetical protein
LEIHPTPHTPKPIPLSLRIRHIRPPRTHNGRHNLPVAMLVIVNIADTPVIWSYAFTSAFGAAWPGEARALRVDPFAATCEKGLSADVEGGGNADVGGALAREGYEGGDV